MPKERVATRAWGGFAPGEKAEAGLNDGQSYPAFLDMSNNVLMDLQYGPTFRLNYRVYYQNSRGEYRTVQVNELAAENYSVGSRFIKRLQTINPDVKIDEDTDLSTLPHMKGWVNVEISRAPDAEYPSIASVSRPVAGQKMPDGSVYGQQRMNFTNTPNIADTVVEDEVPF